MPIRKACRVCGSAVCTDPSHAPQRRRAISPRQRRRLLARDGYRCQECGKPVVDDRNDPDRAVIGHRQPRADGGDYSDGNLYVSCEGCNSRRGATAF